MTPKPALWRRLVLSEYFVLYLSAAYFGAMAPLAPGFASPENFANIFSSLLPLLVVAVGQTAVLITGGIDLSVTSTIALASTAGALAVTTQSGSLAAVLLMLVLGAAVGAVNGAAITALRMPPFIVTLTTMMFFSGLAIWLTQSRNISGLPPAFTAVGRSLPLTVAVAAALALATHWLLGRSIFGRWLYAVGRNIRAAEVAGVPAGGAIVAAYVLCGVCAAVASVIYTGRLETGSPVLAQRILLDVIAAAVIGGASLFGGEGKVLWTAFGVLFITLVDNSLNILGLSNFGVLMAKGAVILTAALLDSARRRYADR